MLRSTKSRAIAFQILLVAAVLGFTGLIILSTAENLRAKNLPFGFDFITMPSRFVISESLLTYRTQDPYYWAAIVGVANTLFVSALVALLSTVCGLLVGVGRLSSNPLVAGSCRVWVEVARNTPPIVLLIFLYSMWWQVLPPVNQALNPAPGVYLSMRGLMTPGLSLDFSVIGLLCLTLAPALAIAAFRWRTARWPLLSAAALAILASALLTHAAVSWPTFQRSNYVGGFELTPELTTVVLGLTLYTTGFIAEIVRAGVQSVSRGQWEAAESLGLRRRQILQLVIIPQMLRVIMPPMTSQYINVVKNSTLAIAVGYPDFLSVMGTVINKSSHAIEGVMIILSVYLALNLTLSSILNWYNRRIALVER
jgi:general L-amino acid transport system permease protein